jgi:hypothetical protein
VIVEDRTTMTSRSSTEKSSREPLIHVQSLSCYTIPLLRDSFLMQVSSGQVHPSGPGILSGRSSTQRFGHLMIPYEDENSYPEVAAYRCIGYLECKLEINCE